MFEHTQTSDVNGHGMATLPPQQQMAMPNPAMLGMPSTSYNYSTNGTSFPQHAGGYNIPMNGNGGQFNGIVTDRSHTAYVNNYASFGNYYGMNNASSYEPPISQYNDGFHSMINGSCYPPHGQSNDVGQRSGSSQHYQATQLNENHRSLFQHGHVNNKTQQQHIQSSSETASLTSVHNSIHNSHSNVPTPQSNSIADGMTANGAFNSPQSFRHSPMSDGTAAPSPASLSRKRNYPINAIECVQASSQQQATTNDSPSFQPQPQYQLHHQPASVGTAHSVMADSGSGTRASPSQHPTSGRVPAMMLNGTPSSTMLQQQQQQQMTSLYDPVIPESLVQYQQQQQSNNSVHVLYSQPTPLRNCHQQQSSSQLQNCYNNQSSQCGTGQNNGKSTSLPHQMQGNQQIYSLNHQSEHNMQPSTSAFAIHQQQQQSAPSSQPQRQPVQPTPTRLVNGRVGSSPLTANNRIAIDETVLLRYLADPSRYDCGVTIFHAKIAQKSYGNEKRFFTPPPTIYLHGGGWQLQRRRIEAEIIVSLSANGADSAAAARLAENMRQGGNVTDFVAFIGISHLTEQSRLMLDFSREDFSTAKSLHISDETKKKYFTLRLYLFYDVLNGSRCIDIGVFDSLRTKVISKPAKRKMMAGKNADCHYQSIASGIKVAFYNRVRSQTGSTRYMHVENGAYNANQKKWGAFWIYLIDLNDKDTVVNRTDVDFVPLDGTIFYGDVVQIVDSVSGISLPPMRIRKVDDQGIVLDVTEREPLNQLHKCAFEIVNLERGERSENSTKSEYLCVNNDSIDSYQHVSSGKTTPSQKSTHHKCPDGAIWVVTAVHTREHRFYEPNIRQTSSMSVGPVPVVNDAKLAGDGTPYARLQLEGRNFSAMHIVCVGSTPVETFKSGKRMLDCPLPSLDRLNRNGAATIEYKRLGYNSSRRTCRVTFPITLVRTTDGVIYGTNVRVVYAYECAVADGPIPTDSAEEIRSALAVSWHFADSHSFTTPAHINARDKWDRVEYDSSVHPFPICN